jgi:excinuclease ABC subunit B
VGGRVILYADRETESLKKAIYETNRRRAIQVAYNTEHNITPTTIKKAIKDITDELRSEHGRAVQQLLDVDQDLYNKDPKKFIAEKRQQMADAVQNLDFETAAILRDEIYTITNGAPAKRSALRGREAGKVKREQRDSKEKAKTKGF